MSEQTMRDEDLQVTVFRNAAPGMRVSWESSAVRVLHLPTGLSAESSTERGQHANRQAAIEKLRKLLEAEDGA